MDSYMANMGELDSKPSFLQSPTGLDFESVFNFEAYNTQDNEGAFEPGPMMSTFLDPALLPSLSDTPASSQIQYVALSQLEKNQQNAYASDAHVPIRQPQDNRSSAVQVPRHAAYQLPPSQPTSRSRYVEASMNNSTHFGSQQTLPQPLARPRYVEASINNSTHIGSQQPLFGPRYVGPSIADTVNQQTFQNASFAPPLLGNMGMPAQMPGANFNSIENTTRLRGQDFYGTEMMPQSQVPELETQPAPAESTPRRQRKPRSAVSKRAMRQKEFEELLSGIDQSLVRKKLLEGNGTQHYAKLAFEDIPPRVLRRVAFASKQVYPLHPPPRDWGCFRYSEHGELTPGTYYTKEQLFEYLLRHPLHVSNGVQSAKTSGLRLWLQRNPADSLQRYGDPVSSRCKFVDCCAHLNLIGQSQFRVCFDERYGFAEYNPFHNAGYVHLYCLEKFLDFPALCYGLNVAVDDRELAKEPLGRNRMRFSSTAEEEVAREFIRKCETLEIRNSRYPHHPAPFYDGPWYYEGSLVNRLSLKKVEKMPPKQLNDVNQRGSLAAWDKHLGNLEIETQQRYISRRTGRGGNTVDSIKRSMKSFRAAPYPTQRPRARTISYGPESEEEPVRPMKPRPRAMTNRNARRQENDEETETETDYPSDGSDDEGTGYGDSEEEYNPRPTRRRR